MIIYIIGPGGVGKSTSGVILAKILEYNFIDLDTEFMKQVNHIGKHIKSYGYEDYCLKNSELFFKLIDAINSNTVFVLSSGFLVHEGFSDLTDKHLKKIKATGISILLLPSQDIEESTEIVVKRQINRGFGLQEDIERKKFRSRYIEYQKYGDIKIYSKDAPEEIAKLMKNRLQQYLNINNGVS